MSIIKASIYQLFKREISYHGRVISADGYIIDPKMQCRCSVREVKEAAK